MMSSFSIPPLISLLMLALICTAIAGSSDAAGSSPREEAAQEGGRSVVLRGRAAELRVELVGGALSDFHLAGDSVNPLRGMGHFLCLDRWGPPSAAEEKNGMPFHGEAWKAEWRVARGPERRGDWIELEMSASLPIAGLEVRRVVRLADGEAVVRVSETVTNRNRLGRIFNMVQHPTIGAPFLDVSTRVDAGARRGLMQSSPLPNPERPEVRWPYALQGERQIDVRRLTDDPNPNVVSYETSGDTGWTTACNPEQQRLIGYLWKRSDYPWFSAWRHVEKGKPALRGLEFGTTGLHQPFPELVKKGSIFGLPLYTHLDAGEQVTRSYTMFLLRTPAGFEGIRDLSVSATGLRLREDGQRRRVLELSAAAAP